ncbi:MAG: hypothetical protein Q9163_005527 [Psora crenata]
MSTHAAQPPPPDLASILQTLSAYTPTPTPAQPPLPTAPPPTAQAIDNDLEEGEYDPASSSTCYNLSAQLQPLAQPPPPERTNQHPPYRPAPPTIRPNLAPTTPAAAPTRPSPAHITTYPAALRHITTHLVPHPSFLARIQHLMRTQRVHERQWSAGRETLLKQIRSRDASRAKLDAVLASVGGGVKVGTAGHDEGGGRKGPVRDGEMTEEEEELKLYDLKVYKAQKEMVKAAEQDLAALGVPFFFGSRVPAAVPPPADAAAVGGEKMWEGKEADLRELRARVVGFLEDLCGEEELEKGGGG